MQIRSLIAGCGSVGKALSARLIELRHEVWGIRRNSNLLPTNLNKIRGDLTETGWADQLPDHLDFVFYLASSDGISEESYTRAYLQGPQNVIEVLTNRGLAPRHFFFVSSTAVYAQRSGEWVDETSPAEPDHFAGKLLLSGESAVLRSDFTSTIVRLSGIYGPDRNRLLNRIVEGEETCVRGLTLYTNRIHRDDCAGILAHLTTIDAPESVYVGVDHEPVDRCILLRWLARKLGAPPPGQISRSESSSRTLRSNKRCSNRRLLESGYRFTYPTFREGYAPLIGDWKKLKRRPHEQ